VKDLRNLPEPIIERLAEMPDSEARRLSLELRSGVVEQRLAKVEWRDNGDGTSGLHGYATVYEYPYDVAGGPPYGWTETIATGACRKSVLERDDVRCFFDHEGIPIARTRSGTMTLEDDTTGLLMDVPSLDLSSPWVQSLRSALDRGDLDEMSFAFRVLRQEWNGDYTERVIREVQLFDVSVVSFPANPATVVGLRNDQPTEPVAEPRTMSLAFARALADQLR